MRRLAFVQGVPSDPAHSHCLCRPGALQAQINALAQLQQQQIQQQLLAQQLLAAQQVCPLLAGSHAKVLKKQQRSPWLTIACAFGHTAASCNGGS